MIPAIQELNFPKIDGKQYATLSHATVNLADMGEKTISTQVKINGDITPDFSRDWEVEFQGEKYIMPLRQPQGAKENTSLNSTIDLTFQHWAIYQLKRWMFFTVQPVETGTAVADKYIADVILNLGDFCNLFGQVLRHYYGDTITIDLNPNWDYKQEAVPVSINHSYIWDVLIKFHELFAVRWSIEPDGDSSHYVIKVGYPAEELDHIFEYGFDGGLLKVERQVQSEDIRNMLLGRGGEKNIPKYYFKKSPDEEKWRSDPDWIEELVNLYFTNLMPATFRSYVQGWKAAHISKYPGYAAVGESNAYAPWAYRKGYTDSKFDPMEYVKDDESIAKYGPLLGGLDNNEEIYPSIQGSGMDVAVDVEQIKSDDVADSAENDAQIEDKTFPNIIKRNVPQGHATASDANKRTYFAVLTGKKANIEGYAGAKAYNPKNNEDKSVFITELDSTIKVFNATTGEQHSASGIPAGDWYFTVEYSFNNTSPDDLNVTLSFNSVKITSATPEDKWRNTFEIWVKNIWETSKLSTETNEQYAERVWKPILGDREQNTAKVTFTTGALAISEDYEFTIVDFPQLDTSKSFGGESSHWRIKLAKSDADLESTGLYVPSTQKQGKAGDKFVFIGTEMTHHYVVWAEKALDDWKKDQLREKKDIKPTWVVTTDRVRLNNEGKANALIQKLRIGNSLRLADKRFIEGDYETLYLQSITYTYREPSSDDAALNPDVAIVLSNEYATTANPVATMQGEISALQRQIGSISNIEQIVRAVGDRLYLRKSGIPDRSLSPTQFFSLLTSGDFRAGLIGGAGWGFFKDENGNWVLEADRVNVRQEMQVNTLVINQAEGRGGMEIDTAAFMEVTRVVETSDGYACYFDQKEGSVANLFHIDDVAYCNRWTPENTELKFYKRRVTAVGVDNITLSKTDVNGSGIPAEKDNIIHFGNYTDKRRQYVKVRDVVGGGYERYIENLDSVNAKGVEYYFVGKQAGESRWFVGNKDLVPYSGKGDGSYIEFKGRKFNLNNVRLSLTSSVGDKTINDFVSDAAKAEADKAKAELQANIDILQNQVDGVIESFNGFGAPTLTNYPANEWTADAERSRHDRDIYTDITPYVDNATTPTSGQSWKWYYNSPTDYGWVKIADSDAVKALQLATMSVRDTDVLYISHASPLQQDAPALPAVSPDGVITDSKGWQTKAPEWQDGRYIWQTTYVRRGDGSASFSDPTCIQGADGRPARSIYLRGTQMNHTGAPQLKVDGAYIYNSASGRGVRLVTLDRQTLAKVDDTTYDTYNSPANRASLAARLESLDDSVFVTLTSWDAIGMDAALNAALNRFGGMFSDVFGGDRRALAFIGYKGLGQGYAQCVMDKSAGTAASAYAEVSAYVADGMFTTSKTAVGIDRITEQYYLSTSRTQLQGGSWSDTRQPWVAGRFYWTRTKITYSDGSVAYKGEICATGEAGADAPNLLQRFSATGGAYASEWHPSYLDGDVWMQTSADGGATWSARMPVGRGGYSANLLEGTSDEWHEFALGMYAFIYAHIPPSDLGLEAGDMFTFSAGYRTGPSGKGLRVGVEAYNSEADRVLVARGNTVRDGEGRAWCSGTVPSGYAELRLRLENADAAINTMSTEEYRGLKLEKGNNPNPVWTPAAGEMVGRDGQWQKFQWAKGTDATKEPTGGWSDTPVSALPGEYVWMRSGTVVPPAAEPAKWERAVRLTGDTGAAGGDVYRLDLDNERAAVACDAAGNVTGPYPSAVASVYKGSVKLADGVAFSVAGQTGISASVSASGVLSLSAMTADTAEVVLQAVAGGVTLQSRMNLYKVRPGSSYTENLVLKSGEEVSSADYGFRVYEVSGELVEGETYTWTIWGTPGAGRYFRIYPTDWNGRIGDPAQLSEGVYSMTAKWKRNAAARKDAFTVLAAPHDATTVSTIHRIKVERGANTSPVWSPAPSEMTGEDAVTYDLQPSAGVIKRGMTGEPDVREVSCGVYNSVGASRGLTGEKTLRVRRIGEDAAESTIAHAGGQCAPVAVTARTGQVVFSLYDSDTLFDESTLLDRERVPVVSDASDLEVGGTNMLPGTKGWAGWIKHGYALAGGTYNGLGVAHLAYPAGAAVGTAYDLKMTGLVLEPDTVYTLSVWAYGTGKFISYVWPDVGGRTYSVNGVPSEATGGTIEGVNTLTGKWRRYWVVFRTRGGSLTDKNAFFRLERHGSEVWLAGAKLEKGNVPTDWSPAPGDVESEMATFDYLKAALAQNGVVESGLALLSLIKVGEDTNADGYIQNTRAGINGLYDKKLGGRTIATWWGGDIADRFGPDDRPLSPVPANAASGLVRMDGSGYLARGLVSWDADGGGRVAGGAIRWGSDGRVTLGTGITIDVTSSTGIKSTLDDVVEFINGITKFLSPARADGTELKWKDYKEGVQLKARMSLFSAGGVTALDMGPEISGRAVGQSVELLTDWRHDPAGKALGAVLGVELRDIADHADSTAASAELKASNAGVRVTGLEGRLSRLSRRTVDRHVRRGIMPLNAEPGIIYRNQGIAKMRISKHPGRYTVDLGEYLPPSVAGAAEVHLRAGAAAVDAPPSVAVFSRSGNKVTVDILSQYAVAGYPACIMLHVSFRMDYRYLTRSGRTGYIASADGSGVLEEPLPPKPTAAEMRMILTAGGSALGFEVQRRRRFLGGRKPGNHGAYVYKWCLPMKGGYGIGLWRVRRRTHNHGYASGWVYAMCGRGEMKILW